jgi:hypothetical protein
LFCRGSYLQSFDSQTQPALRVLSWTKHSLNPFFIMVNIRKQRCRDSCRVRNQRNMHFFKTTRADTTEQSADTRADTAKCKRRLHRHSRYEGEYARYRDFQYLALSDEYLRICSCIFHWYKTTYRKQTNFTLDSSPVADWSFFIIMANKFKPRLLRVLSRAKHLFLVIMAN